MFCIECEWLNPDGALFCSKCGSALQGEESVSPVPSPGQNDEDESNLAYTGAGEPSAGKDISPQMTMLIVVSMLLVVVLYLISFVSKQSPVQLGLSEAAITSGGQVISAPLSAEQQQQVQSLENEINQLNGEAKISRQRDLIDLLLSFERLDHAATVQQSLAEEANTPEAWQRTGDLFYDWMEYTDGQQKLSIAQNAIAAYERVLSMQPDNLDVKTDLAWTYQYDQAHVMDAITYTDEVLEADPNHLKANYNRAIFLMHINRFPQAVEQFQIVKQIAGEGSPFYEQAETIIRAIEAQINAPDSN